VPPGGVAPSYRTSPKNQLRAFTARRERFAQTGSRIIAHTEQELRLAAL